MLDFTQSHIATQIMITSSPSPTLRSSAHSSPSSTFAPRSHYDGGYRSTIIQVSSPRPRWAHAPLSAASTSFSPHVGARPSPIVAHKRVGDKDAREVPSRSMVDASTQYSPPEQSGLSSENIESPASKVKGIHSGRPDHPQTATEGRAEISHAAEPSTHPQMASPEPRAGHDGVGVDG